MAELGRTERFYIRCIIAFYDTDHIFVFRRSDTVKDIEFYPLIHELVYIKSYFR